MHARQVTLTLTVSLILFAAIGGLADEFTLDWWTVDGGGAMWTAGGTFELSGTVGQPDANTPVLAGGDLELSGGFWVTTLPFRGDMNCDGTLNAFDIDPFVLALVNPPAYEAAYPNCNIMNADCDCDGAVGPFDIDPFVLCLTVGCPVCP